MRCTLDCLRRPEGRSIAVGGTASRLTVSYLHLYAPVFKVKPLRIARWLKVCRPRKRVLAEDPT